MCDPMFSGFSRTPTCDRQTQTERHRHRAIAYTASRGKKSCFGRMMLAVGRLVRTEQTIRCKVIHETEFYDTFYY